MSIATVADIMAKERAAGSTDQSIACLLNASNLEPPTGHGHWNAVPVREVMGEDAAGFRPDGHYGGVVPARSFR